MGGQVMDHIHFTRLQGVEVRIVPKTPEIVFVLVQSVSGLEFCQVRRSQVMSPGHSWRGKWTTYDVPSGPP